MDRLSRIIALVLWLTLLATQAVAAFPDRPVRFVVPFPPGGGTDAVARILGGELSRMWGQQVVIDNRAGAQGSIGTAIGLKAPADGYTIVLAHQGVLTVNPHLYDKIGFDPIKDLAPVAMVTQQPFVLVVNPSLNAHSLKELTELAKKQPGELTFASSASGPQMAGELYKIASGTNLRHVAYKGAGPAVVDVLAGHVDMMIANPTSAAPHVKSGKLRALVVFGSKRMDALPDVPTAAEAGYPQLGENPEWYGVAVPAGTPSNLIEALNAAIVQALGTSEVQKAITSLGLAPAPSSPEVLGRQIKLDHEEWRKVVQASGAKAE